MIVLVHIPDGHRPPLQDATGDGGYYTIVMEFIGAIIIGLLAGGLAKFLMPGKDPGGCLITILLGLAGSFVGTYLGQALGLYRVGEPAGFIGSVIGALLLLLLYRLIVGRRAP